MVTKGVLFGTAAALVLGVAFVAAALVSRPHEAVLPLAPVASKMQVTLVTPKEPASSATGAKLETVPPGAPDAPTASAAPLPPPRVRAERPRLEPEPSQDDFVDEPEQSFTERYAPEPYRDREERWREPRFAERPDRERRYGEDRGDDNRFEPFDPEPPPWWRR